MRGDISTEILQKTALRNQGIANNANPKLSLVIGRKQTILDDFSFVERRRVRRNAQNTISDIGVAVCHPKIKGENTSIWIPYINQGKLYVRWSYDVADLSDLRWNSIPLGQPTCTKCDAGFPSRTVTNDRGEIEHITEKYPFIFYIKNGAVRYIKIFDVEGIPEILDAQLVASGTYGIDDITARQTPSGLALFYLRNGGLYYIVYNATTKTWGSEQVVGVVISGVSIVEISSFDLSDGVGLLAYGNNGKFYQLIGDDEFDFGIWQEVSEADGTGFIAKYYDGSIEAFYNHDSFKYRTADNSWQYGDEKDLHSYNYSVVEGDHANTGTIYIATLMHGNSDIVYCIKYTYMRDVSDYTKNVTHVLQQDNPITQINVIMKNIKDSLYTSDATLFAPSSMMKLGVSYGDSEVVDIATGYIDEVNFKHGEDVVTMSGRNKTGILLADQTFDEDIIYNDLPSKIVKAVLTRFGIDDYAIDPKGDLLNGVVRKITLEVEAKDTGLKALQTVNDILSNGITVGQRWKFEETYDGKIVVGYDDFRSQYIPKGNYIFDGRSDVFAESVDRCADGVYTQVRCTGTTDEGKLISYTYSVKNFRFWRIGNHRTYHAKRIDGITKSDLKTYAKALAKQLKYAGRVVTYKMNLKPQLQIGDVAKVTYDIDEGDDPEQVGFITEINHNLGVDGYFTEFIITSGGDINEIPNSSKVYSSDKAVNGTNRKKRLNDYFGNASTGGSGGVAVADAEPFNFVETIRNIGLRLLDEPIDVEVEYDDTVPAVKFKWTDPLDISTNEPVPVTWAGTIIVRSEAGAPIHRWDRCILITDSTTRDAYKTTEFVDSNVEYDHKYYYGIFPYDTEGHYRYTKVIYVETPSPVSIPQITSLSCDGVDVSVTYDISEDFSWDYVTLVYKEGSEPADVTDGTAVDIAGTSEHTFNNLKKLTLYFFKIFSQEHTSEKEFESDVASITTGVKAFIPAFTETIVVSNIDTSGITEETITK